MLAAILAFSLLVSTQCIPLEEKLKEQPPAVQQQEVLQPKPDPPQPAQENPALPPPQENPALLPPQEQPNEEAPLPDGGAPPPLDLAGSPDANPEEKPGSDLDTDATFWGGYGGWGYRPYWGGYGYPSRRWGGYGYGGRGYGGYGGWGWGGRGWGWGGRGWGWGGRYWG